MKASFGGCAILIGLLALSVPAIAAEQLLFNFSPPFDTRQAQASDASIALSNERRLHVTTHHAAAWPGITLPAPTGHWDLSSCGFVQVDWKNVGTNTFKLSCRVDNPGADGRSNCVTGASELAPGTLGTITVPLTRTAGSDLDGKLFGMKGFPAGGKGPNTVDPGNITQLILFVAKSHADHSFEVVAIRAAGSYTPPTAWVTDAVPFFPFIDEFGQYRHKDWPGKTHSQADLAASSAGEATNVWRSGWDEYGGWMQGPRLRASGYFRTEKYLGKWWLVDPDGRLFFSQGIDCVGARDSTPIEERDNWFADFPGRQPEFAPFLSHAHVLMGHYAGRTVETFSFFGANLRRKYGPDWEIEYPRFLHQRLHSWGINTIGNWSDPAVVRSGRTPYTDAVSSGGTRMIEGSEGYWGKFPDVFDTHFAANVQYSTAQKHSRNDPWCIGYFSDNEMSWGDETSLAVAALRSPPDQPAKLAFVSGLRAKYGGIEQLNRIWKTQYATWDALLQNRESPDKADAAPDLEAFYTRAAEQYFRVVRDAIKSAAPHQLYLGCRFAAVNRLAAAAAAKYCDVVSYNLYRRSVANFKFDGGADVPLLIGEFHFGALDRGLFHPGLVPTENQTARAQAYRDYVLGAVRNPQFVGCHWFQYHDEPVTGRTWDGENYQIGFVDVADTPYPKMVAASREVAAELYRLRANSRQGD